MIPSPSYTNLSYFVAHAFNRERMQARKHSLLAYLLGRNNRLKYISDLSLSALQNKRHAGLQSIPTEKIVGTVSRTDDFDSEFRPRKSHLRERWVAMFILLQSDSWAPIVVHKAGDVYYVEDGHHRVSVARSLGMRFIEAEVWDHSSQAIQPCVCPSRRLVAATPVCACAAD